MQNSTLMNIVTKLKFQLEVFYWKSSLIINSIMNKYNKRKNNIYNLGIQQGWAISLVGGPDFLINFLHGPH